MLENNLINSTNTLYVQIKKKTCFAIEQLRMLVKDLKKISDVRISFLILIDNGLSVL